MKTKHSQHKKIKAVSKHICNSHNPTHIPKTAKELALLFLLFITHFFVSGQTYEYTPSLGTYVACPSSNQNGP